MSAEDHWISKGSGAALRADFLGLFGLAFGFCGVAGRCEALRGEAEMSEARRGDPEDAAVAPDDWMASRSFLLLERLPFFHSASYHSPSGPQKCPMPCFRPSLNSPSYLPCRNRYCS